MTAKYLTSILISLSTILAIHAQLNATDENNKYDVTAIYYGDSNVKIGDKFTITCIIPINSPIHWYKNDEPIIRHNLRHGRDEHSYVLYETPIEGEKHRIEAHISVRHALKVHEGKYRCNNLHANYHHLRVYSSLQEPKLQTQSPFIVLSEYNPKHKNDSWTKYEATEAVSIYETMPDLKPHKDVNDIFTRVWTHPQQTTTHQSHHHHHYPHHENIVTKDSYNMTTLTNLSDNDDDDDSEDSSHKMKTTITAVEANRNYTQYPYIHTNEPDMTTIIAWDERKLTNKQQNREFPPLYETSPQTIAYETYRQREQLTQQQQQQHKQHQQKQQHPHQRNNNLFTVNTPSGLEFKPTTTSPLLIKGLLVPNYDNAEHQAKFFDIRHPLVLNCNVTQPGVQLSWERNNTDVSKVKGLENRYKIIPEENKFIIEKTEVTDDGLYSCVANNERKDFHVYARVLVGVPSNIGVVEGEKLTIICNVLGTDPKLQWSFGNLTIFNTTDRYVLKADENHVENAILTIENVSMNDKGQYKCIGSNLATSYENKTAEDTCLVRVKGKLAALWPFLGICAEVLILCTIILIYEKRRNKSELEESDTDPQEQ